ncbi:SDR family NAD(P)-dependent oxidoreductase [Taklimakanibacter lacteus]|uniref:SDR family NAD(P)-dependent oxidoreductase n=1 Tax=Taklimakanibacter lacteus TaxID=2268456 RepID=UPI000E66BD04
MSNLPLALITGGSRGLGFETARQLGRLGYRLFIASRTKSTLENAARTLRAEGYLVTAHAFDMQDAASIELLVDAVKMKDASIDVLINCAGVMYEAGSDSDLKAEIGSTASVLRSPERNVTDTIAINMIGTWSVTRALAPYLARGARIVNVSSSMASLGEMGPGYYGYRASKAGINVFTRTLAYEMRPRGILVNSVCPGWVKTNMGGPGATRDVAEGAAGIVWAATLPPDGPTGGFFRDGQAIPW